VNREGHDLKHLVRAQSRTIGANMATMGLPEARGKGQMGINACGTQPQRCARDQPKAGSMALQLRRGDI
jgi:hypothetical protein